MQWDGVALASCYCFIFTPRLNKSSFPSHQPYPNCLNTGSATPSAFFRRTVVSSLCDHHRLDAELLSVLERCLRKVNSHKLDTLAPLSDMAAGRPWTKKV